MKRDSNIELLRILAILMIIASHFSLHGIFRSTQFQNNLIVADFFNQFIAASLILGDVGVGIFFTITGYFYSCKEKIMLNKKIIAAIISYSVLNVVIIFLFGFNVLPTLSNKELVKYILKTLLMPITSSTWWFASAYIYLIVLISPLVNSRIKNTSKKGYYILVVLMLFFMYISNILNNPVHGVIKALTYYLIGGYIRRYFDYELKKYLLVIFGVTITLLLHCVIMYYSCFSNHIFIKILGSFMYNIFVCPVMVMTIFIFFKNIFILKERNVDFINLIADTTFGIYLLHDSPFVRPLLWSKVIPAIDLYKSNIFPLYALVSILVVFAFSSVFNILYKYILEKRVISIVDNCVVYIKQMVR